MSFLPTPARLGRLRLAWIALCLLALSAIATATPRAPQQAYAIDVPGLGALVLFGRDPQSAVRNYTEGLIRRGVFPGKEKVLRAWARSLVLEDARPVASLPNEGRPISGIQMNTLLDLVGDADHKAVRRGYADALEKAAVFPLYLPIADARKNIGKHLGLLDHLLLMGGDDLHPTTYGRPTTHANLDELNLARDHYELSLVKKANEESVPITGICRGHQLLGVASGGELVQDLVLDHATTEQHAGPGFTPIPHAVEIAPDSSLTKLLGSTKIRAVRSMHHQAVLTVGGSMKIVGRAPDGIAEAIEGDGGRVHGYQFHPEKAQHTGYSKAIFRDVARRATKFAQREQRR